jgi:hypothetical protein
MMLTAKKNIQAKKARVQEKLAGVEFLEENDNKKVELKNELADVEAELAEVDAKYTELIAKSKDSESEVIDMSTGAKDAVNEADVKANADESSSPLGLSGEEGEGELEAGPGFEFDAQESQEMPPALDSDIGLAEPPADLVGSSPDFAEPVPGLFGGPQPDAAKFPLDATPGFAGPPPASAGQFPDIPLDAPPGWAGPPPASAGQFPDAYMGQAAPMLESVGSQEADQKFAMPSAQMSQSDLARSQADAGMTQGLTGGMTSDMLQATNQGMAAASGSGLAATVEDSHLSGDHPIIPDKFLGEALKIGYDPERDQAWRTWMPADILAKVDAQVQKAKAAANSAN